MNYQTFYHLCLAIANIESDKEQQDIAIALWNMVDHMPAPEGYWAIMLAVLPACFHEHDNPNSIIRDYVD